MQQSILVTGGGGFIGTWVLKELINRDLRPIVLDQQRQFARWQRVLADNADQITCCDASLTDPRAIEKVISDHDVSHIIHLAALLTPDCQAEPFLGCEVNVLGSTAIFEAARRSGRIEAIAYASSFAVNSDSDDLSPPNFYGAFKQAFDMIAKQYHQFFGVRSIAIRPHVVYGPERTQGLTAGPSLACRAASLGEKYTIEYSGQAGYDYVEDVARAFVAGALKCPDAATIVDLPSEPATPEQIVSIIHQLVPESVGRIDHGGPPIPLNVAKDRREISDVFTDWKPTSLHDGIKKTIRFYQSG